MKSFTLCFFGLLLLGVLAQTQGDSTDQVTKTRAVAHGVVNYFHGLLSQRKANILKRFSDQASLLQSSQDTCSLKRANKITNLSEQFQDLHSCTIVDDLVTDIENVLANVVGVIGEVISAVLNLILGVVSCLTQPSLDCVGSELELLVTSVLGVIGHVVSVIVGIVAGIIGLLVDLLKCLNVQQVFEEKFEVIMKSACHEI